MSGVALVQWLTVGGSTGALPADVSVPVAVHAAAAYGRVWASRAGLAVTLLMAVLAGVSLPLIPSPTWAHLLVGAFFASTGAAAWAIGGLQRVRRRQVEPWPSGPGWLRSSVISAPGWPYSTNAPGSPPQVLTTRVPSVSAVSVAARRATATLMVRPPGSR